MRRYRLRIDWQKPGETVVETTLSEDALAGRLKDLMDGARNTATVDGIAVLTITLERK